MAGFLRSAGSLSTGGGAPLSSEFKEIMGLIGELPSASDDNLSDDERKLRGISMKAITDAFDDGDTKFMSSAFGRLLTAQAAEGTDAGVRQFRAATGSFGSAAAAATEASIRSGGAADLHKAALEARSRQRAEVGGLLSFMANSIGRESNRGFEAMLFNTKLKAGIIEGILGRKHDMAKVDKQIDLAKWQTEKGMEQRFYDAANQAALQQQAAASGREAQRIAERRARDESSRQMRMNKQLADSLSESAPSGRRSDPYMPKVPEPPTSTSKGDGEINIKVHDKDSPRVQFLKSLGMDTDTSGLFEKFPDRVIDQDSDAVKFLKKLGV